jgi:hypothetical protein
VDLPFVAETCFVELARGVMVQLLNFTEVVVISRRSLHCTNQFVLMAGYLPFHHPNLMAMYTEKKPTCTAVRSHGKQNKNIFCELHTNLRTLIDEILQFGRVYESAGTWF